MEPRSELQVTYVRGEEELPATVDDTGEQWEVLVKGKGVPWDVVMWLGTHAFVFDTRETASVWADKAIEDLQWWSSAPPASSRAEGTDESGPGRDEPHEPARARAAAHDLQPACPDEKPNRPTVCLYRTKGCTEPAAVVTKDMGDVSKLGWSPKSYRATRATLYEKANGWFEEADDDGGQKGKKTRVRGWTCRDVPHTVASVRVG